MRSGKEWKDHASFLGRLGIFALIWLTLADTRNGFVVPGVAPVEYQEGSDVEVRVRNSLYTSHLFDQ